MLKFPVGFYWGSATSAHQVEGGNVNDWSEWEKNNAARLAQEAGKKWKVWQQKKFPEMFNPENYISGQACNHYHLYEKDFNVAKSLGHNAHRFSIEWSRVEPEEGRFNEKEIGHYRQVISALTAQRVEPFVTLWHRTNPLWIRDIGGWENKKTIDYFNRYVEKIVSVFKNEINFWIVLNEPELYVGNSYLLSIWPPKKKNILSYILALNNLAEAHKKAYGIIKTIQPKAQVGMAEYNIYFKQSLFLINWFLNKRFLNKVKNYQDFIGLNYYRRFPENKNKIISDLRWEIYPKGIYRVLKTLKKYQKPIYVTENGVADAEDEKRTEFIKEHLRWIHKAIQERIDVRGYFYWSLLDNFEWDKGFWPRFGLVGIDYKTLERRVRPSAWEYAKICRENRIIN